MEKNKDKQIPQMKKIIDDIEEESFIGRTKELNTFLDFINNNNSNQKILHIYGIGGIGKSFLLQEYARYAAKMDFTFIKVGSDILITPSAFLENVISHLEQQPVSYDGSILASIQVVNKLLGNKKVILAFDSYEKMQAIDRWIREVFIRQISSNVFIIIAGRYPLQGEWEESPSLRKITKQIKLDDFTLDETKWYLKQNSTFLNDHFKEIWKFTNGHPLLLSLITLFDKKLPSDQPIEALLKALPNVHTKLIDRWLQEVYSDEALYNIIETAAFFHTFNQSSLTAVLGKSISTTTFQRLLALSFIRDHPSGWSMQELVRDSIKQVVKQRNPHQYKELNKRLTEYYYHQTLSTRSKYDIARFFYHVENEMVQSTFFHKNKSSDKYLEPLDYNSLTELNNFIESKHKNIKQDKAYFYNRQSNKTSEYYVSAQHNRKEAELVDFKYIEKVGYDSVKLLKNLSGEILGMSIIIPINERTIEKLVAEPVSRAFFRSLNVDEWNELAVSESEQAGWFIRTLEFSDQADESARSFMLYNLFSLLLSGRKIIISTVLEFYQQLIRNFGFEEVPGATHFDFGEDQPCPTYILDLSGPKLADYLKQFMNHSPMHSRINLFSEQCSYTGREKEIVSLIMDNNSNQNIADQLHIAEVTVKKHVTQILKKANVENRGQLIKKVMEFV